ncbi:MAG: DNA repair protein RecO [Gammaproteobacteria bacterium]|nr:DNA repair protein RecO [Gammaproteobacteria bacterium]
MTQERISLEPAFLLHQLPYRESSALIDFFTHHHGRIRVLAKGVRSVAGRKARYGGVLQPFQPLLLSWGGRGELPLLYGVEVAGFLAPLVGNHLISGFYLNELLLRMTHRHEPHSDLFGSYHATMVALRQPRALAWLLRLFERDLLAECGYAIDFNLPGERSAALQADALFCCRQQQGIVPLAAESHCDGVALQGKTLMALASGRYEAADAATVLPQAKQLLRYLLSFYLGDKPLQSRALLQQQRPRSLT